MLALTRESITPRGLESGIAKVNRRVVYRWTWALRVVIAWIQAYPACEVTPIKGLFVSRHGSPMTAQGFKSSWNRAMRAHVAAGGVWIRENDIRAKTPSLSVRRVSSQAPST